MGRVINTDSPGKRRNQQMRTVAEILRHLSQKQGIDDEVKDMVATLVYCLRDIDEGIDHSALAWEKRDYWMKAEEFRNRWHWVGLYADELLGLVLADQWDALPAMMVKLFPHYADINVTKFTRKASDWKGNYEQLIRERPPITE